MLAADPNVVYIYEPFNIGLDKTLCYPRFDHWFVRITAQNEAVYGERIRRLAELRYPWWQDAIAEPNPRHVARAIVRGVQYAGDRVRGKRALIKDPIALLSADWLAERLQCQNVVLLRHPCAYVRSTVRMKWRFDNAQFHKHPEASVLGELLGPFHEEIARLASTEHDILENAAMHWKHLHWVILQFREKHPDWTFAVYEDIADDPVAQFEALYKKLGLTWDQATEQAVLEHSTAEGELQDQGEQHRLVRDSRSNAWSWRAKMPQEEIDRVREITGDVARHFYADSTWEKPAP
jgi:hypothetical protein